VQLQLNRGESRHELARRLFFGVFCKCLARPSKIHRHEDRLLKLPADPKDLEF